MEQPARVGGGAAADGANSYTFKSADILFDIPIGSSRVQIADRDIPFLQMVLHGYIPYAGEAGNLFYDHDVLVLKWLEYGCLPYYELTYQSSEKLINTGYAELFSSHYLQCRDQILETYRLFRDNLDGVWNSLMTEHTCEGDISKITYESGRILYLNYSEQDVTYENNVIPARGFLVR